MTFQWIEKWQGCGKGKEGTYFDTNFTLTKLRSEQKSAYNHSCCVPGVCALVLPLLMTSSGIADFSWGHWTKRHTLTPAVARAPLLRDTPTFQWHNQGALLPWLCPCREHTVAPEHLADQTACSCSAHCNREVWPPVCWGHRRRLSLCSEHIERCGLVSGWGPA